MQFISFRNVDLQYVERVSFRPFHSSRPSRSERPRVSSQTGYTNDINLIPVMPHAIYVEGTDNIVLLRVGFRLELPNESRLPWFRLRVQVLGLRKITDPAVGLQVISFAPKIVSSSTVLGSRMEVDDDGTLHGIPIEQVEQASTADLRFQSLILGYRTDDQFLVWDFLPEDRLPPLGSQNLYLTFCRGDWPHLQVRLSMQLCLEYETGGKDFHESKPERYTIRFS